MDAVLAELGITWAFRKLANWMARVSLVSEAKFVFELSYFALRYAVCHIQYVTYCI